ncbi:hypothetical protein FOA52_000891 [Chlamydomonas sp. UWO 241]|nr:hypothetical protein FOA52_000891 [Chlamydomonas sp. UWO 241]
MGASVLLNGLLFARIWGHLARGDKKPLRAVGRVVRALADDLVVTVSMHGKPANELGSALALWPDVERLEADCDDVSATMISAAPLSKLMTLVLKCKGDAAEEWSVPTCSGPAAAGLEDVSNIDSSCTYPHLSIKALRGCAKLRTLSLQGFTISDHNLDTEILVTSSAALLGPGLGDENAPPLIEPQF